MTCRVSIIIPTLNEAATLERTLRCLTVLSPLPWEILIIDGNSEDETVSIAQNANISVFISSERGRAQQMNQGAEIATGDVLCFLHADTFVPDDLIEIIDRTLADKTIAGGGFISLMTGKTKTRWFFSSLNTLKTFILPFLFRPFLFFKGFRLLFGDQVMFCRRDDFLACGGFDPLLPIMEDADLCLKLTRYGRICQINRIVISSDRRVTKLGETKALAIYFYIAFLWFFGVSHTHLKQFYAEIR
ncbi:glycosyl transferase family 2 [Gloeothece citriformis PCC 7424]|uniref:4,4'-diaponeurosporenoate glycosyltransferase n=1 Tax=Gloeothece citriformis (strain PCC 7424) TaxID=65393 RepID=B7KGL9_GLOC7|nr:TIGR04283 family arsenosugar biosynthesis glycosyltransferase [Gloeothece citriformis]ACK71946.1 glycosyl transferase family 2 [Gloeothece citriformis PCC 7424]